MSEHEKQLLAQALREFPTWGDAYIATLARAERAEATNTRLHKALTQVEWVNHGDHRSCPGCGNWEDNGHHPECPVRRALAPDAEQENA